MLDDAVSYVAQDSHPAAERLLIQALELDVFSERGRIVPELNEPNIRQLLVQQRPICGSQHDTGCGD